MTEKTLDRNALLALDDLKVKEVPVPAWGKSVYIRQLTAGERESFDAIVMERKGFGVTVALCLRALSDASGQRLFTDEDTDLLAGKSSAALDQVFEAASNFNALNATAQKELEKNSGSGQDDASSSSSASSSAALPEN